MREVETSVLNLELSKCWHFSHCIGLMTWWNVSFEWCVWYLRADFIYNKYGELNKWSDWGMAAVCLQGNCISYRLEEVVKCHVLAVTAVYLHYNFEFYKYEETSNCRLHIAICHVLGAKFAVWVVYAAYLHDDFVYYKCE